VTDSNVTRFQVAESPNEKIGVCLMKSTEAQATYDYLTEQCPEVRATDHGTYFQFEAEGRIMIPLATVSEYLGRPMTMSQFLVCMTTYYGRICSEENTFIVTAEMSQLEDRAT
jgi:hypothetical protein